MQEPGIYITREDAGQLFDLIVEAQRSDYRGSAYLQRLKRELERAAFVEPQAVPPDVITMNSTVQLQDLDSGDELVYTLVFPAEADVAAGKISVLAPIGTAMLGYRSGDTFQWDTPEGMRAFRVVRILFQPESAQE